ncbi:MAG TPA: DUF192 domain-containing protein [Casimicrobiaceae bacterium]|jgi:uncharacterized membrane protein (UPF0127 family)|nr:DUF192 domain-containing protein [Casimicrobiaceae bacterium]
MKRRLAILVLATAAGVAAAAPVVVELPTTTLSIGKHKLVAEVAATPEQRTVGLMYRFSLKPDHGMIFVFERPEPQAFWMKNTFIPLSIAFLGGDGRILNIEDMAPRDESLHWSRAPAQYAIEMRKGWFAERGIGPGDRVEGLPLPQ